MSCEISSPINVGTLNNDFPCDIRDKLLSHLKKEVKQLMEEAVMKRFIHEEGASVTALCVAVESCLAHNLKRRIFGLFGSTSTFGLIHKISPLCPPAASVVKMVVQIEQKYWKTQKSGSFDKQNEGSIINASFPSMAYSKPLPSSFRYLWIRLALFEKLLATIVECIVNHAEKYYDADALMRDPVSASMVAALLVGPCALEYSKVKTLDNYWTDPPADELLQRQRIHSRGNAFSSGQIQSPKSPRLSLQVKRTESLGPDDTTQQLPNSAREYVMSLHQNTKANLLYGKNGVTVWPVGAKHPMKGYLSLHQNINGSLTIKWTPNELMHSGSADAAHPVEKGNLWQYAISLDVRDIVYLHCHQRGETEGSIVFVGADGIQYPPIEFPLGQHPLAFLSCLENGMLPWGQLDPPLWLHKGKGKVFPKLKRRSSFSNLELADTISDGKADENKDYVFRVVPVSRPFSNDKLLPSPKPPPLVPSRLINLSNFSNRLKERLLSLHSSPATSPPTTPMSLYSGGQSPVDSSPPIYRRNGYNVDGDKHPVELMSQMSAPAELEDSQKSPSRRILRYACDSMRHQILSRAFYGWLAHCRHMKTIRTHLICLVNSKIVSPDYPVDASDGLVEETWQTFRSNPTVENEGEFYRLVYFGSMSHTLRKYAWPYLLGIYEWCVDEGTTKDTYKGLCLKYEGLLTEWISVEAIVRERDKEAFKTARRSNSHAISNHSQQSKCSDSSKNEQVLQYPVETSQAGHINKDESLVMDSMDDLYCGNASSRTDYINSEWGQTVAAISNMAACSPTHSTPEEGEGGVFSKEVIDLFAINLHRIEKDVHRCDRNHPYFTQKNLEKLKNIMCTYVWENLHAGYVQGMCDICAPLLVVFDDEILSYSCFSQQMKRLAPNFPHGGGMDVHLANARALLQVLDPELFDLMHQNGDYTHFYFAYRWFLLDFKRELSYEEVFRVWETIWASPHISSNNFILFLVMAAVQLYRDIIIDNNMDFTDVIKFFNEMAEKHDGTALLDLARNLVLRLQRAAEK